MIVAGIGGLEDLGMMGLGRDGLRGEGHQVLESLAVRVYLSLHTELVL